MEIISYSAKQFAPEVPRKFCLFHTHSDELHLLYIEQNVQH